MKFHELAQQRESCRAYQNKAVPRDLLVAALETARLAPSACNSQPWHAVLVDDPQQVGQVAKLTQDKVISINRFTDGAQAFYVLCETEASLLSRTSGRIKDQQYAQIDLGLFCAHLTLALREIGLGSCILGWFDEKGLKELLAIPRSLRVRLVVSVGYPEKEAPRAKVRKELQEIVSYNQYGRIE